MEKQVPPVSIPVSDSSLSAKDDGKKFTTGLYVSAEDDGEINTAGLVLKYRKNQGVTKRCRLSWQTNSALVYEPKCKGLGGGGGVSQPMSSRTWSPNKLWRSNSIFYPMAKAYHDLRLLKMTEKVIPQVSIC